MADVLRLATLQELDNQSAVETLEEALEEARAGQLQVVAIARVSADGVANASWSSSGSAAALVGAIALLQKRVLQEIDP